MNTADNLALSRSDRSPTSSSSMVLASTTDSSSRVRSRTIHEISTFKRIRLKMKDGTLFEKFSNIDKQKLKKKKQRYAMTQNIVERTVDVIFHPYVFVNVYRAKLNQAQHEIKFRIGKLIDEVANEDEVSSEQQQQHGMQKRATMQSRVDKYRKSHESYSSVDELKKLSNSNFNEITTYLQYQASLNTLDRIQKQEMQVFSEATTRDSSSSSAFFFPFSNFAPSYDESDLCQLKVTSTVATSSIDSFLRNYSNTSQSSTITCFKSYNDKLFAIATSNGNISVRDLLSNSTFDVTHFANTSENKSHVARGQDIVGLEFLTDECSLLAYHESGAITLSNFRLNRLAFIIDNLFKYSSKHIASTSSQCIIDLKVLSQNEKKFEIICAAVNAQGDCILAKITKGFLSYDTEIVTILRQETFACTQIIPLPPQMQQVHFATEMLATASTIGTKESLPKFAIFALISPQKLYIIRVLLEKMKATALFKLTENLDSPVQQLQCSFTWAETMLSSNKPTLTFVVSFTSSLYLSTLTKVVKESKSIMESEGNREQQRRVKYSFEVRKRVKHYTSIVFVGVIHTNLFLICDFNKRLFLINSSDFQRTALRSIPLSNLNSFKTSLPFDSRLFGVHFEVDDDQVRAQRIERKEYMKLTFPSMRLRQQHSTDSLNQSTSYDFWNGTKNQITFHSCVSFSPLAQSCLILCEPDALEDSQFIQVSLVPWREQLDNLMNKQQHYNAMHFLHTVRSNNHKFVRSNNNALDIELDFQEQLSPQIQRVAISLCARILLGKHKEQLPEVFTDAILDESSAVNSRTILSEESTALTLTPFPNEMKPPLMFIIEFLVSCQQEESIYDEIRRMCYHHFQSPELFIECLQPFILEGKISQVPNDVLTDIISYHEKKTKKSMRMIQRILTSIDVYNLDTKPLIALTLQRQLIPAMVYLSTKQRQPDFLSPLLSFWSGFVGSLPKIQYCSDSHETKETNCPENAFNKLSFVKEQTMLAGFSDHTKEASEHLGLRALWFFRLCMQQRLIDGEFISGDVFDKVTLSFFETWLIKPENIRICLLRWPEVFFDMLKVLYSEKTLKIINEDKRLKTFVATAAAPAMSDKSSAEMNEFFASSRNMSASDYLLRTVIQEYLDIDRLFSSLESEQELIDLLSSQPSVESPTRTPLIKGRTPSHFSELVQFRHNSCLPQPSFEKITHSLRMRRRNLVSNCQLFLAHLIYESQCRDDSSYLGGLFGFKTKKAIEIVFYIVQHHIILKKLEFSQQELLNASKTYGGSYSSHTNHLVSATLIGNSNAHNTMIHAASNLQQTTVVAMEVEECACDYHELAQVLRSDFMLSLIKYIYPSLSEKQRGELSQLLDATELITAQSHVLLLREQYHRATESYIFSTNNIMSSLVFNWLEENLTQSRIEDPKKFQILQEILRKRLPDFIRINPEKTHQLFQTFLPTEAQDIITKLSKNPVLQLLYISNIVKQEKQELLNDPTYSDRIKVDTSILVRQVQLMCQLNKPEEMVVAEITSFDYYPLKDILSICLEKQYMEACSYIYLRMGQIDQAIRAQIRILESILREYKADLEDFSYTQQRMKSSTVQRTSLLLDLVRDNPINEQSVFDDSEMPSFNNPKIIQFNKRMDDCLMKLFTICATGQHSDRPDKSWFLLLDLLGELRTRFDEFVRNEQFYLVNEKFKELVSNTIKQIAEAIPMEKLAQKIQEEGFQVNMSDLKGTFCELLDASMDTNSILQRSLHFLQEDLLEATEFASKQFLTATTSKGYCASCLDPLSSIDSIKRKVMQSTIIAATRQSLKDQPENSGDMVVDSTHEPMIVTFYCGHSYHSECYYKQRSIHVCTECLKQKGMMLALMSQRKDIVFPELLAFIVQQQQAYENNTTTGIRERNVTEDMGKSKQKSSAPTAGQGNNQKSKEEQEKEFKKLKALAKLKLYDKNQQAKYAAIQPELKPSVKKRSKQRS